MLHPLAPGYLEEAPVIYNIKVMVRFSGTEKNTELVDPLVKIKLKKSFIFGIQLGTSCFDLPSNLSLLLNKQVGLQLPEW